MEIVVIKLLREFSLKTGKNKKKETLYNFLRKLQATGSTEQNELQAAVAGRYYVAFRFRDS